MRPDERVGLARQAYQRALAGARQRSTRATWGRLLTASRNLKAAKVDRDRAMPPARSQPDGTAGAPVRAARERTAARKPDAPAAPPRPEDPGPALETVPVAPKRAPSHDLAREWERSRVLREQARALVAQTRLLRCEIAMLARMWGQWVGTDR